MIEEERELRAWIQRNKMHFIFGHYTPIEVGMLARMVDFDPMLVYRVLSHWEHALAGTEIKKQENKDWNKFLVAARIKHDLTDQWTDLAKQLNWGTDWER